MDSKPFQFSSRQESSHKRLKLHDSLFPEKEIPPSDIHPNISLKKQNESNRSEIHSHLLCDHRANRRLDPNGGGSFFEEKNPLVEGFPGSLDFGRGAIPFLGTEAKSCEECSSCRSNV